MAPIIMALLITILVIISFAVQIIPLPLTALLGSLVMMLVGITTPADVVSSFGSDTVMMVAGVIIVGNAIFETGLAEKIGKTILSFKLVSKTERRLIITIMSVIALLSAFISNAAAMAMFLPVVASIAYESKGRITKKRTYIPMAVASVVGGFCTLAGSTPQMVAQEILLETEGVRGMTFFELTRLGVPVAILSIVYFVTVGYFLSKKTFDFEEVPNILPAKGEDGANGEKKPKNKRKQLMSGLILLACVLGFVSGKLSFGTIGLLGACACVLTGCISQKRVFETMDWSTIVVLGGSIGFAKGMDKSGAVGFIGDLLVNTFGGEGGSAFLILALLVIVAAVLSNVMSNTATVAVLTPLAIDVALKLGSEPITFVIGVVIAGNLAFSTPIATPPLTMVLVAGYRFKDYVKVGGLFNIIALAFTLLMLPILYHL